MEVYKLISIQEAGRIKERLIQEKMQDNRFAAITCVQNKIEEKDFRFFKTSFQACDYILDQPIEKGHLIYRPISLLEDDVNRVLEGKIATQQKEPDPRRGKGLDLER